MFIQRRKLRFKAIYNNPLAEKLKAKQAKALLNAQLKKKGVSNTEDLNFYSKTA